jgi:hypothetical protein
MRRAITSIVSLLLLIAVHGHGNGLAHANPHPNPSFVPGEILVKFREGVPPRAKEALTRIPLSFPAKSSLNSEKVSLRGQRKRHIFRWTFPLLMYSLR